MSSYSIAATNAIAKTVIASPTMWLVVGLGPDYDSCSGFGVAGIVDMALRKLPVSVGVQYQQDLSGTRVTTIDVGFGLRGYR